MATMTDELRQLGAKLEELAGTTLALGVVLF